MAKAYNKITTNVTRIKMKTESIKMKSYKKYEWKCNSKITQAVTLQKLNALHCQTLSLNISRLDEMNFCVMYLWLQNYL